MARRGSRRRLYAILVAIALEALLILAIPLGANLSVPVSPSQCPLPVAKPVKQVWVGSLIVNVASLEMKIRGAKRLEPYVLVHSVSGSSVAISLGTFNGSYVKILGVSRTVPRFVGPMALDVDVGDNVTKLLLPPNEAYYDPSGEHYVFQYFYPGTGTVATIFVKPLYHRATISIALREQAKVGVELCMGKSCRLAKVVSCAPGNCTISIASAQPFQYTRILYVYRCGVLNAVASEEGGLRIELRENAWVPLAIFAAAVTITVCIGVRRTKRFK